MDSAVTSPALASALFSPRRIALIGASTDANRLTARAQVYLRRHGFAGELFPVNPRAETVLGEPAYKSLNDVPGPIDFAYVLVGTQFVEAAIADCAARNVPVACVLADGFAETGPEGVALQRRIVDCAHAGGVRLLGPNSMGMINVPGAIACSVNAALEAESLLPGRWSLVSHSGSVTGTLVSRAAARGFGFAKIVGTGNEADLTAGEIASLLVDDPETDAILLFLETIRRPDLFEEAARRAHAAGKPIVAYKLGRSEAAAKLATTHTGALAGSDAASEAFFRAIGIVRVDMLETLLELPPLLLGRTPPVAPKRAVHVVTTTGGGGAMVVDRLGMLNIATAHMLDTTLAGAVKLNIQDDAALRAAAAEMQGRLGGQITGFIVQPMAKGVGEAILSYRRDPLVGPIVALGAGGVLAEVYRDVVLRLAPVSETEALEMIEGVKGLAPARGYRGMPKGDLAALARAVAAFSRLAALAEVTEAEINPVIVLPEGQGVVMADALLVRGGAQDAH